MATPAPVPNPIKARGGVQKNAPLIQNIKNDNVIAAVESVPEIKDDVIDNWINTLYDQYNISDKELDDYWNRFAYKGFNVKNVRKQLFKLSQDVKLIVQIIIVIALRGPQQGSMIKLNNDKTLQEMGIPASGGQGNDKLTCNKIQAATADLAAFFLKRKAVPKRINVECPGWLQFPSAGSIKMPAYYRVQHLEFARKFSVLIGGTFQEQIYLQMEANAYLDERLKLFDDIPK